jgi:copper chaperone CopZ
MKHLILTVSILGLFACGGDTTSVDIQLTSMQCGMCESTIEEGVKALDGVVAFDVDLDKKVGHIEYKAGLVDLSAIEKAISALGYSANNTQANAAAYEALPGCCKLSGGH